MSKITLARTRIQEFLNPLVSAFSKVNQASGELQEKLDKGIGLEELSYQDGARSEFISELNRTVAKSLVTPEFKLAEQDDRAKLFKELKALKAGEVTEEALKAIIQPRIRENELNASFDKLIGLVAKKFKEADLKRVTELFIKVADSSYNDDDLNDIYNSADCYGALPGNLISFEMDFLSFLDKFPEFKDTKTN
ncbi:MAG: hypothetical protein LW817_00815 [Candidatus Caenarcaniphilales bacterium]|jgi:hypothetical protein|nr:hypothetical protein [Candidatus Caenarcaniphilales bacterium]